MVTLGHPPPRGTTTDNPAIYDPASLASIPGNVILGRVDRIMKIMEVRGFAFQSGSINLHVCILFVLNSLLTSTITQTYQASCDGGEYDILGSHCVDDIRYTSMDNNDILGMEYQCKDDTLLDIILGSCRYKVY